MHKTVKNLIEEAKKEIEFYQARTYYEKEVTEKLERIRLLRKMWRKHGSNPLIKQMTEVVDNEVTHYHADFFLHDLLQINKFSGRFAWYVGDCGTHLIWLDNETAEEEKNQRGWLEAVQNAYGGRYKLYEVNTNTGVMKKIKFENLNFKIIKQVQEVI